jgi:hypothetical protein
VPAQEQSTGRPAFVTTDQTDYKPGDAVVIFGNGWLPNEIVTLTISEASGAHADTVLTAEADEYGNIVNKEFTPTAEHLGASFTLTATGQSSGRTATAKFTDGGTVVYSPGGVTLTAFSGPGGSTTGNFNVSVTMPAGNGNIQPGTQFVPTGANPFTANWTVTSTSSPPGNFNTGNNNNGQSVTKTFAVSVTPPVGTPAGTYTALLKANAPNSVSSNPGILMQVTVTADNNPPTTTLSAADSNGNPYTGPGYTNANKVTLTLTAADGMGGSGLASTKYKIDNGVTKTYTGPFDIAAEGVSVVTYFSVDNTGAQEAAQFFTVKIDKSAPTITASAATADGPYTAGTWTNKDVTVTFNCVDNPAPPNSGVASVTGPQTVTTEGANQSAAGTCTDGAGNSASTTFGGIRIDKTAPTLTFDSYLPAPNAFGWNNTDVVASYNASDALSGLVDPATGSFIFSAEGINQSHAFSVQDKAGNAASSTVSGVNIDKTAPTVTITSPAQGAVYAYLQAVTASYSCADTAGGAQSGVNTCAGTLANGASLNTASVGPASFTVNAADKAGNTATQTNSYAVYYESSGFLPPINVDGTSIFKLGSTVPVKFKLTGASAAVTNAGNFQLFVAKVSNGIVGTEMEATTSTPASTGNLFRYDASGGLYIYNMGTKGAPWSAGTYQLRVDLGDGNPNRTVLISLKP